MGHVYCTLLTSIQGLGLFFWLQNFEFRYFFFFFGGGGVEVLSTIFMGMPILAGIFMGMPILAGIFLGCQFKNVDFMVFLSYKVH